VLPPPATGTTATPCVRAARMAALHRPAHSKRRFVPTPHILNAMQQTIRLLSAWGAHGPPKPRMQTRSALPPVSQHLARWRLYLLQQLCPCWRCCCDLSTPRVILFLAETLLIHLHFHLKFWPLLCTAPQPLIQRSCNTGCLLIRQPVLPSHIDHFSTACRAPPRRLCEAVNCAEC
jgi:hypothetical protein